MDVEAWPLPCLSRPHPFVDFFVVTQRISTFWGVETQGWGYGPQIRTSARFLYNAPNRQVSSIIILHLNRSEVILLTNKLTNKQTPLKTSTLLCYATPVGS